MVTPALRTPHLDVHLVDATYELFRAHYAPRPAVLGRDGVVLSGVVGLVETLLALLRDEGATHVACATDRVIRSFRNDLYPGYKTDAGMPPELLAQFPVAERAIEALGIVLWPMVEFEADDALASAAWRWRGSAWARRAWRIVPLPAGSSANRRAPGRSEAWRWSRRRSSASGRRSPTSPPSLAGWSR